MGSSWLLPLTSDVGWLLSAMLCRTRRNCLRYGKKSDTVSTVSPSISHEVMGLDAMIFVF